MDYIYVRPNAEEYQLRPTLPRGNKQNKISSRDEMANVNFYTVRHGSYPNSLK